MIDTHQLRELVIGPALDAIDLYCRGAEELLMATAAQESKCGYYLKQLANTPMAALGLYQMQPDTHDNIWDTTLMKHSSLGFRLMSACNYGIRPKAEFMIYNLRYASMMARVFWLHVKEDMPKEDDLDTIWYLYKKYWNTSSGKATKEEFFENYSRYVKGEES